MNWLIFKAETDEDWADETYFFAMRIDPKQLQYLREWVQMAEEVRAKAPDLLHLVSTGPFYMLENSSELQDCLDGEVVALPTLYFDRIGARVDLLQLKSWADGDLQMVGYLKDDVLEYYSPIFSLAALTLAYDAKQENRCFTLKEEE